MYVWLCGSSRTPKTQHMLDILCSYAIKEQKVHGDFPKETNVNGKSFCEYKHIQELPKNFSRSF